MTKTKTNLILQEASEIKDFIEKNKKIPMSCKLSDGTILSPFSVAYLMALLIKDNFKSNSFSFNPIVMYNTSSKYNDTINGEKVKKDDYLKMVNNFITYCQNHKRVPAYITTLKSKTKVSFELFTYCISKILVYYKNNKKLPNYCLFNKSDLQAKQTISKNTKTTKSSSTSTTKKTSSNTNSNLYISSPHYTKLGCNNLGQCTPYCCGPHSVHQAIRKFNITKYNEKQIAAWAGTTTSGTSHSGINTAIAKISSLTGIKLKAEWKNFSSMGSTPEERFKNIAKILANKNKAIIWHIGYRNGGNTTTGTLFGHYECIDKINIGTKYVRALNSLGTKNSDGSYNGKLQDRSYNVQSNFAANTPGNQAALCIISKG